MSDININSETWRAIVDKASQKIADCLAALEKDTDEKTTTRLRGKISALRDVLTWPSSGHNEPSEGINLLP